MYGVKWQLKLANVGVHMYAPAFCIGFRSQYHVVEDRPISVCAGNLTSGFEHRLKTYGSHLRRRWHRLHHRCPLERYQVKMRLSRVSLFCVCTHPHTGNICSPDLQPRTTWTRCTLRFNTHSFNHCNASLTRYLLLNCEGFLSSLHWVRDCTSAAVTAFVHCW